MKRSKVKVNGNKIVTIVFHIYIREKWMTLRQTKTKMISGWSIRYSSVFAAGVLLSLVCLSG